MNMKWDFFKAKYSYLSYNQNSLSLFDSVSGCPRMPTLSIKWETTEAAGIWIFIYYSNSGTASPNHDPHNRIANQ